MSSSSSSMRHGRRFGPSFYRCEMMPTRGCLLLLLLLVLRDYTSDGQRYNVRDEALVEKRQAQVNAAGDVCVKTLKTSLGETFLQCVLQELEKTQDKNEDNPFPVPPYKLHPLTVDARSDGNDVHEHGTMLLDLLRNYTCGRIEDGGSLALEETSWQYDEKDVMTKSNERTCPSGLAAAPAVGFSMARGYLPSGDDVGQGEMTVKRAKMHCDELPDCEGFTFEVDDYDDDDDELEEEEPFHIYFKGVAELDGVGKDAGWRSYVRKTIPARCLSPEDQEENEKPAAIMEYSPPQTFKVEIIRREPLVAKIPNFATEQECLDLIEAGGSDEDMGRAHEADGPSSYRRSYSENINVDYEDRTSAITRFAERMFAFVRDVTGYDVHGPGQEPINAVLYKDVGDEYRPHCDGPCNGGPYPYGQRVATSILYCETPKDENGNVLGGQTSFTRSGLMVAPQKRDLLLFAYKYPNGTMDNGFTEHSGCKILGGRKWIATQWYREGVDYDQPWSMMGF